MLAWKRLKTYCAESGERRLAHFDAMNWKLVPAEPTIDMMVAGEKRMAAADWVAFREDVWRAMLAAAPEPPQQMTWRPIETAPQTGCKVILSYLNRNNKARTVMARWLTDEQAAETDGDGVGLECGWYECIDNWDDYTEVAIHEGEPSHWMPLPAPPTEPT